MNKMNRMKQEHKILLIGIIAIGLLDTLGSIASRQLAFNYSLLFPVSFMIYGTIGFLVARSMNLKIGVVYGASLGLFDSTIGLGISRLLDANTGNYFKELTTVVWIVTVMFMICIGALVALIGGGIARIVKKSGTNA